MPVLKVKKNGVWELVSSGSIEGFATEEFVNEAIANLIDSAPETLNTLKELSAALGEDPNFATTVANQIGNVNTKVDEVSNLVGDTAVSTQISYANINGGTW